MNYILTLCDYLNLKPTPIVEIKDGFKRKICKKIINEYKVYKNFSKVLGTPYPSLMNYLFGRSRNVMRFDQLYKICKILNIPKNEMAKNILKIRPKKYKNFSLPLKVKPTKNLSNLIGHVFGDGHIGKTYCFSYTNKSKRLQKDVFNNIRKVFGFKIKPRILYHKAYMYNYPYIVGSVLTLCGAPLGDKKYSNFDTPKWIKLGSQEIKKEFIKSIFDDEASVKLKGREIVFKLGKKMEMESDLDNFLESLRSMLTSFDIEPSKIRFDTKYESKIGVKTIQKMFGIYGQKNFKKFQKSINFLHPKKRKFLSTMINSCQVNKHRRYEAQNIILNMIKTPMTTKEISNKINSTPLSTYKNLRKLESRGLITQKKFPKNTPSLWIKNNI